MVDQPGAKKLLVTGASGFLGWTVCQRAASRWQVVGTTRSRSPQIPHVTLVPVDVSDRAQVDAVMQAVRPDAVLHLAAMARADQCEAQPDLSFTINVNSSVYLAQRCAERAIPFGFTSTDLVFDGQQAPYAETASVSPLSRYGEQKAIAEAQILQCYPAAVVCRMPLLFGAAPPHAASFLQPFVQTLRDQRPLRLFTDEFRTPLNATTAADGLLWALETVQGLLHLGGPERISRYEFGRLMVELLNLPATGLVACRQQDLALAAPRPPDVSLDSRKAFGLGFAPPSLREQLLALNGQV
jgi:dTDP-4-dehydrorhamnose reductase